MKPLKQSFWRRDTRS